MNYIIDLACISPQPTFDHTIFDGVVIRHSGTWYEAMEPDYTGVIPAGLLRRMGKAVRMGVGAGLPLLEKDISVDGVILGTANGGLEDCLKFLNQIVDYNEGTLTPTNFVQSTPNTVAGNLALLRKLTGYNMTHVHKGLAFENALLDALMLLEEKKLTTLLVGSIEEISQYNYNIDSLNGYFKTEETSSDTLLNSNSAGSVNGEGAAWFVISSEPKGKILAELVDITQIGNIGIDELTEWISVFLRKNGQDPKDIELLLNGRSGDSEQDVFYSKIENTVFADIPVATFKNLVGEYPTASSFALWLATNVLNGKPIPDASIWNGIVPENPANVLIYNHFRGEQHSLILLNKAETVKGK